MSKNIEKAISKCRAYAKKLELPMNIIGAKYDAENGKLIFHFESQKRVDFRELLKLLQNELSIKIELRQIGPRDQAKEMGGIGPCGQVVCCARYMKKFESVSVKVIKKQGLKGSPQRYAGYCGKLQCCLKFELDEKKNKENFRRPERNSRKNGQPAGNALRSNAGRKTSPTKSNYNANNTQERSSRFHSNKKGIKARTQA